MASRRRSRSSRAESEYPTRSEGTAQYHTRRTLYDDLAMVIRRFPPVVGAPVDGRPFVLVHGIGVSSRYFRPSAAQLAKYGTVYLVDLPGYGSAPNPHREVSIAEHADVLARFLVAEGIDAPVLVGHSMGTQVVSQLVLDHPGVTDRIVLLAPTMDPAAREFWHAAGRLMRDILTCEPARVNAIVSVDYFFRCGVPYFLRQTRHLLADRIEDRLPLLEVKGLVIRGDKDCVCPEGWTRRVAGLLKDGSYAEVPGPHVIMFTDPPRVAALIADHARA
jgi:pimeloyl-ACP methyl ester carboxylesterase